MWRPATGWCSGRAIWRDCAARWTTGPEEQAMYDVMEGVRVVEVAEHTFVPAASMILADWGADVIKIERVAGGGDASRTMRVIQRPGLRSNPFFEAANRGKRRIGLDLTQAAGRE